MDCLPLPAELDGPGPHDPVSLGVRDVVVDAEHVVGVDPAVAADDGAVLQPVLLAELAAPRLVLEEPLVPLVRLTQGRDSIRNFFAQSFGLEKGLYVLF